MRMFAFFGKVSGRFCAGLAPEGRGIRPISAQGKTTSSSIPPKRAAYLINIFALALIFIAISISLSGCGGKGDRKVLTPFPAPDPASFDLWDLEYIDGRDDGSLNIRDCSIVYNNVSDSIFILYSFSDSKRTHNRTGIRAAIRDSAGNWAFEEYPMLPFALTNSVVTSNGDIATIAYSYSEYSLSEIRRHVDGSWSERIITRLGKQNLHLYPTIEVMGTDSLVFAYSTTDGITDESNLAQLNNGEWAILKVPSISGIRIVPKAIKYNGAGLFSTQSGVGIRVYQYLNGSWSSATDLLPLSGRFTFSPQLYADEKGAYVADYEVNSRELRFYAISNGDVESEVIQRVPPRSGERVHRILNVDGDYIVLSSLPFLEPAPTYLHVRVDNGWRSKIIQYGPYSKTNFAVLSHGQVAAYFVNENPVSPGKLYFSGPNSIN